MNKDFQNYSYFALRVLLGVLMLVPGIGKLMNPAAPTGMLASLGFPMPMFFAWILLLSEIVFGVALIAGWKVKYTAWPPVIILAIATMLVVLPIYMKGNLLNASNLIFHLVAIAGYLTLASHGPGIFAASKH